MRIAKTICSGILLVSLLVLAGCPGNVQQGGGGSEQSSEEKGGGGE